MLWFVFICTYLYGIEGHVGFQCDLKQTVLGSDHVSANILWTTGIQPWSMTLRLFLNTRKTKNGRRILFPTLLERIVWPVCKDEEHSCHLEMFCWAAVVQLKMSSDRTMTTPSHFVLFVLHLCCCFTWPNPLPSFCVQGNCLTWALCLVSVYYTTKPESVLKYLQEFVMPLPSRKFLATKQNRKSYFLWSSQLTLPKTLRLHKYLLISCHL